MAVITARNPGGDAHSSPRARGWKLRSTDAAARENPAQNQPVSTAARRPGPL
jgi:hypothetical protein